MTDINDLDQYIGRYVTITDPDGKGCSGFIVEVFDEVHYDPHPTRTIVTDYGYGWPVGEATDVNVLPASPYGEKPPQVTGAIDVLHQAAHSGKCPDGNCRVRARTQVRAFREWRMKATREYWDHRYLEKVRYYVKAGDMPALMGVIDKMVGEGASDQVVAHFKALADREAYWLGFASSRDIPHMGED